MIGIILAVIISQVKVGDEVYILAGASAYRTSYDAIHRDRGVELSYAYGKVIAIDEIDGERALRIEREGYELPIWTVEKNVNPLDEKTRPIVEKYAKENFEATQEKIRQILGREEMRRSKSERDQILERVKPFCVTKPEHEAVAVVIAKGLDPLKVTPEQAQSLSPSQRRALSSIKARYAKAKAKTKR